MADNQPKTMEQLQRDAERRMREMQARSNRALNGNDMPPVPNFVRMNNRQQRPQPSSHSVQNKPPEKGHTGSQRPIPIPEPTSAGTTAKGNSILGKLKGLDLLKLFNFNNLNIDNDTLIIIALIFLLSTEETDELLLLALVYIML